MQLEITDRYGGHWPDPATVCSGPCDGMGRYPSDDPAEWPEGTRPLGTPRSDGTPDDGWRFLVCPVCEGSGHAAE